MLLQSTITCPHCAAVKTEIMPTDACQFFYECTGCGTKLKPNEGAPTSSIFFDPDTLGPFLWFGSGVGEKISTLEEKIARHTKPNAMREKADGPAHRGASQLRFSADELDELHRANVIGKPR
jgi:rubredoxin